MNREQTLVIAHKIVCEGREEDYGSPEQNFKLIANLWTDYLGFYIEPKDVAMMMALLKIARIKSGKPKEDNYIDLAGYAACGAELDTKETTMGVKQEATLCPR